MCLCRNQRGKQPPRREDLFVFPLLSLVKRNVPFAKRCLWRGSLYACKQAGIDLSVFFQSAGSLTRHNISFVCVCSWVGAVHPLPAMVRACVGTGCFSFSRGPSRNHPAKETIDDTQNRTEQNTSKNKTKQKRTGKPRVRRSFQGWDVHAHTHTTTYISRLASSRLFSFSVERRVCGNPRAFLFLPRVGHEKLSTLPAFVFKKTGSVLSILWFFSCIVIPSGAKRKKRQRVAGTCGGTLRRPQRIRQEREKRSGLSGTCFGVTHLVVCVRVRL